MNSNAAMPMNEAQRLEALRRYEILDTPPDGAFDHITAVTAALLRVPIAIISLVDHDRIWFKSHHGLEESQVSRGPGLCASAILSPDIYEVRDASIDPSTLANPLVAGTLGLRFYAAVPLHSQDGHNLGTLCVIDRKPRQLTEEDSALLKKLAALVMEQMDLRLAARRIAALEKSQSQLARQLQEANQAMTLREEQFRDLFEEAPIAYVYERSDSRFLRANRAAIRILGIEPEEVTQCYGKSFVPDTPDAQRRLNEALASIGRGSDSNGVVLELRRKDNGNPIWVQWWSRPAPDGDYSRSMFVDITDHVLMEQEQKRLQAQNDYLNDEIRSSHNFGAIIGESPSLKKVMQQTQLVASTGATVLITGQSGTGKELIARAIHDQSPRKDRVLIKVNCSAVPESLFESEFFGHVRGAFTGAMKDKPGRFELADGGTLFLDEIGEIPLAMQAKLLRVLQEQELERIGDTRTRKVDVRVIAATNRDLKKEVDAGRFRQDLFYRLSVFPIEIPALRDRREDIPLLALHFARDFSRRMNRPSPQLSQEAIRLLLDYPWPGNVRELQNAVERAVILSQGGPLHFDLANPLPNDQSPAQSPLPPKPDVMTRQDRKMEECRNIAMALEQSRGKIFGPGGAAKLLGMKPTTLASRIKSLKINRKNPDNTLN